MILNDWKDFIFVVYVVFFGAYALDSAVEFLCAAPIIVLGYIGLFAMERKTMYLLPVKREKDVEDFLDVVSEINEFDEVKILEIKCEKK